MSKQDIKYLSIFIVGVILVFLFLVLVVPWIGKFAGDYWNWVYYQPSFFK